MNSAQIAVTRLARIVQRERLYIDRLREALRPQERERVEAHARWIDEQYGQIVAEFNARDRLAALERLRDAGNAGGVR